MVRCFLEKEISDYCYLETIRIEGMLSCLYTQVCGSEIDFHGNVIAFQVLTNINIHIVRLHIIAALARIGKTH